MAAAVTPTYPQAPVPRARTLLQGVRGQVLSRGARRDRAEQLAEALLELSQSLMTEEERGRAHKLSRLMDDPYGQVFTTALTDRLYRSQRPQRVVDQLSQLCARFGIPKYLSRLERAELLAATLLGRLAARRIAQAVQQQVRRETRSVLLSAAPEALRAHLEARHREGVLVNVNQLGEALLGEEDAERRVARYIALAGREDVDALSVKISSIASQLNLLAFESTRDTLRRRLERIYLAARGASKDGCLVMLDMESYDDVELTLEAFMQTLSQDRCRDVRAGVVLQAYLPDSHALLARLLDWAEGRVSGGGRPPYVRFVKGANLAHERVESARMGRTLPIYGSKEEVDASFKALVERAAQAAGRGRLQLGVASHNVFDIAYALLLREEHDAGQALNIELLEGMADPVLRALCLIDTSVLAYAPICADDAMTSGIAYLVRRLDENTGPENFLRASFGMTPGDPAFERERRRFRQSVLRMAHLDTAPRRAHDRGHARAHELTGRAGSEAFENEPDTDFSRNENRAWIRAALKAREAFAPDHVASCVAGSPREGRLIHGFDPSRPSVLPYTISLADARDVEAALICAARDPAGFSRTDATQRAHLLWCAAESLRARRAQLIAALVMDGGKRVIEADAEVSEAIDFAEYYRRSLTPFTRHGRVALSPRGSVLVTPPWNFPLAIAAGGILAALMAGNRVIFKPALETPLVGQALAEALWSAGVPREVLQLVVCEDEIAGALVRDRRVDAVILTGATATARLFQRMRPALRLLAETGGKNVFIVTGAADREQAIAHAVASAFGHAGQKCSAASLLLLEDEVYDDPAFAGALRDATQSLFVGSAWDPRSFVTPLIRPPEGPLARAVATLEPGESWLVAPEVAPDNPRLLSPGVKWGVQPDSFTYRNELFGPVLGVMRARSLEHALTLAEGTGYGLTAGLASLDEHEQALFIARMQAGNLYINRTTTGAIVRRQPFGGYANSGFGPGAKAGGPNYVLQLCQVRDVQEASVEMRPLDRPPAASALAHHLAPPDQARLRARIADYARAAREHFALSQDPSRVLGQDNLLRYLPATSTVLRVEGDATLLDVASSCAAASLLRVPLQVSVDPAFEGPIEASLYGHRIRVEPLEAFVARLTARSRIRVLGQVRRAHHQLSEQHGSHLADAPVTSCGRIELLHYVREQSISRDYHRYGNLGIRGIPNGLSRQERSFPPE